MFWLRKQREPPPMEEWPASVVSLDTDTFHLFIDRYPLSLVDFWAPWCSPCHKISPRVKRLSQVYRGKVAFGKLDIETHTDIADQYQVMSIPYLVFFSYGKKVASLAGAKSMGDIKRKITGILKKI